MSDMDDLNQLLADDQVPIVVKEIMELLNSNVTESKTTMDHLIEVKEIDVQIRNDMGLIAERLAKIRDLKEQIELVYISKTLN